MPRHESPYDHSDNPDELKGPGGLSLRQIHALTQASLIRDQQAVQKEQQPRRSWWQRWLKPCLGRSGGAR